MKFYVTRHGQTADTAARCPGESVLVVCHGGICRIIESYFLPKGEGGEIW